MSITLEVQLGGSTAKHKTLVKLLQPLKQSSPNDVMSEGKDILVKLLQQLKQSSPNDVMPEGKDILVKLLQ